MTAPRPRDTAIEAVAEGEHCRVTHDAEHPTVDRDNLYQNFWFSPVKAQIR